MSVETLLPNYFAQTCFVKKFWYVEKGGSYFCCCVYSEDQHLEFDFTTEDKFQSEDLKHSSSDEITLLSLYTSVTTFSQVWGYVHESIVKQVY